MKKLIFSLNLLLTLNLFAGQHPDEFRAGLLLGQFSIEKSSCTEETCLEQLTNLKSAFEKIKSKEDTETVILQNVLAGNTILELTSPMKKAINSIYPTWIKAYPELKLNIIKRLYISCDSGITEVYKVQESDGPDSLYTSFEVKSFSNTLGSKLIGDILDENTLAFYIDFSAEEPIAEFKINEKTGYFITADGKEKFRRCEFF